MQPILDGMSARTDHRLRTALDRLARATDEFFKSDVHDTAAAERACRESLELMRERAWSAERAGETLARAAFARSAARDIAHDVRRSQLATCLTEWCAGANLDAEANAASTTQAARKRRSA